MQETKKEVIEQLKQVLKRWNHDSEFYYKCTKKEMKFFLEDIKKGHYDRMFQGVYYYSLPSLMSWHKLRLNRQTKMLPMSPITIENYGIYQQIQTVLNHIRNLINGNTYTTTYQTPPTEEEMQEILNIYQNVLITDYTYNEAQEVKKRIKKLQIYDSKNFPHNKEEIAAAFFPQIINVSPEYKGCAIVTQTQEVTTLAQRVIEVIKKDGLKKVFASVPKCKEESYIRRMILSQIDIPSVVYENFHVFFKPAMENIREALQNGLVLGKEQQELLWRDTYTTKNTIIPLVTAVLSSLESNKKPLNIVTELQTIQKENNCSNTMVTRPYQNRIYIEDTKVIYSMDPKRIPLFLQNLQNKYNNLYAEATDYEFVEGCVEIMGDLMMSQIFMSGNKRTAKCLFNKLLMSRGILPPVVDLNEDELALWDDFVTDRNLNYRKAKQKILTKTKEMAIQFEEGYYDNPVVVAKSATSRPEFGYKYYRR